MTTRDYYIMDRQNVVAVDISQPPRHDAQVCLYSRNNGIEQGVHLWITADTAREIAQRLLERADDVDRANDWSAS